MTLHPTAPWAAVLALSGATLIWATRQGTRGGTAVGFLIALAISAGFGVGALAPLALFVLGSGLLTRLGRAQKERLGAAERDRGRRGAKNALAKLFLPALAGGLAILRAAPLEALALIVAASLAGAFADTAATELGPLAGGRVLGLKGGRFTRLAHGAPGGMSAAGLAAAAVSSALIGLLALGVGLLRSPAGAGIVAASGTLASLLESLLAGTPAGTRIGHFGRNVFVSLTSTGAALGARAAGWIGS